MLVQLAMAKDPRQAVQTWLPWMWGKEFSEKGKAQEKVSAVREMKIHSLFDLVYSPVVMFKWDHDLCLDRVTLGWCRINAQKSILLIPLEGN